MKILARATLAALLFGCAACTTVAPRKQAAITMPVPSPAPRHSFWHDDPTATGAPLIQIVLSQQRAYFYKGKELIGASVISSGKRGFDTPPGQYKVIQKDKNHFSNLYGEYVDETGAVVQSNVDVTKSPMPDDAVAFMGARMDFFLRFTGGYGMHAGRLPGYRASHGCVRMPSEMAEHFFNAAQEGMPVTVLP